MTLATAEPPCLTKQMTADEAKEITGAIRGNFDSLGKMLVQVRERKGYLALGYKSLESYCFTEFGKGKSRIYQAIEEARIEEEIIGELSSEDFSPKSLKMPGTYLRTLRDLPSPQQKVEAIKYANLLAEQDGKKRATKLHLQVAALKVGGQKSEQTRKYIEEMGFVKGTEVEITEGYGKGDRGVVKRIDKEGQLHVDLYNGNSVPFVWDVEKFKIVPGKDKPAIAATEFTASIGDTVKIFNGRLKGKTGTISACVNAKQALIQADGELGLTEIPYAELEIIAENTIEQNVQNWENDLIWAANWDKSSWYYNAERREIKSFPCPGIVFPIEENTKLFSPSEWLENWRNKYASTFADVLLTPDDIATLVMAAAIKMSDTEKQDFLSKINILIKGVASTEFLVKNTPENSSPGEATTPADFLVESPLENPSPGETTTPTDFPAKDDSNLATEESWLSILEQNNFVKAGEHYSVEEPTEIYRDWSIYSYNIAVADISHPNKGIFSINLSEYIGTKKQVIKPVEWLKNIINQVEDFCPWQLPLQLEYTENSTVETQEAITDKPNPNWQKDWLDKNLPVRPQIGYSVTQGFIGEEIASKLESLLDKADILVGKLNSKKIKRAEIAKTEKDIKSTKQAIKDLEFFNTLQIGMLVSHQRNTSQIGVITNLTMSTGRMPEAWVKWGEQSVEVPEKLSLISIRDEKEEGS